MSKQQQDTNEILQPSKPLTVAGIVDLLIQGHSFPQIVEFGGKRAEKLLPEVCHYFDEVGTQNSAQVMGFAMEALRDLYRRSLEIGDLANAKSCIVEIAKLAKRTQPANSATAPKRRSACRNR